MKVLIIRDKTLSFNGGIKRHCDDLYALMSACDVDVMCPWKTCLPRM